MKSLLAYEASDGRLFKTSQEASEYESIGMLLEKIEKFCQVHQIPNHEDATKLIVQWTTFSKTGQLDLSIRTLDFTARTMNCLLSEEINKISDLIQMRENDLLKITNMGRKSIAEVKLTLLAHGLTLRVGAA